MLRSFQPVLLIPLLSLCCRAVVGSGNSGGCSGHPTVAAGTITTASHPDRAITLPAKLLVLLLMVFLLVRLLVLLLVLLVLSVRLLQTLVRRGKLSALIVPDCDGTTLPRQHTATSPQAPKKNDALEQKGKYFSKW